MEHTRIIRLRVEKLNKREGNDRTIIFDAPRAGPAPAFRDLFVQHYAGIRAAVERFEQPGLALIALEPGGVAATACIAAKADAVNTAIVGRHGLADVYLPIDPSLSLRHLMVILHPDQQGEPTRFRIVNLRTDAAFEDEDGRRLDAVEADGPVFIRCGAYALLGFPIGPEMTWPADPEAGWAALPERVFLDEWDQPPPRIRDRRAGVTLVRAIESAEMVSESVILANEPVRGTLTFESDDGRFQMDVAERSLAQGVLLGRYPRCDNDHLDPFNVLSNPNISRVHVLLLEIDGAVYALDTASSNGLQRDGQDMRVVPLGDAATFTLCGDLVRATWTRRRPADA